MSYIDICIMGWNLNAFMFVVNFLMAIRVISSSDRDKLQEEKCCFKRAKRTNGNVLSIQNTNYNNYILSTFYCIF